MPSNISCADHKMRIIDMPSKHKMNDPQQHSETARSCAPSCSREEQQIIQVTQGLSHADVAATPSAMAGTSRADEEVPRAATTGRENGGDPSTANIEEESLRTPVTCSPTSRDDNHLVALSSWVIEEEEEEEDITSDNDGKEEDPERSVSLDYDPNATIICSDCPFWSDTEEEEAEDGNPNDDYDDTWPADTPGEDNDDSVIFAESDSCADPNAEATDIPFWFGNEDADQMKAINNYYSNMLIGYSDETERTSYCCLNTSTHRKRSQESLFVGMVHRLVVRCSCKCFSTVDEVRIYSRDNIAPGSEHPEVVRKVVLTDWDLSDGVPLNISFLSESDAESFLDDARNLELRERNSIEDYSFVSASQSCCSSYNRGYNYLYAFPRFIADVDAFEYVVANEEMPLRHYDQDIQKFLRYGAYLPTTVKLEETFNSFEADVEEMFMMGELEE